MGQLNGFRTKLTLISDKIRFVKNYKFLACESMKSTAPNSTKVHCTINSSYKTPKLNCNEILM